MSETQGESQGGESDPSPPAPTSKAELGAQLGPSIRIGAKTEGPRGIAQLARMAAVVLIVATGGALVVALWSGTLWPEGIATVAGLLLLATLLWRLGR